MGCRWRKLPGWEQGLPRAEHGDLAEEPCEGGGRAWFQKTSRRCDGVDAAEASCWCTCQLAASSCAAAHFMWGTQCILLRRSAFYVGHTTGHGRVQTCEEFLVVAEANPLSPDVGKVVPSVVCEVIDHLPRAAGFLEATHLGLEGVLGVVPELFLLAGKSQRRVQAGQRDLKRADRKLDGARKDLKQSSVRHTRTARQPGFATTSHHRASARRDAAPVAYSKRGTRRAQTPPRRSDEAPARGSSRAHSEGRSVG